MTLTILVFGLRAFETFASAGQIVGNGGDVLECVDPKTGQVRVELLDLFEARARGIHLDLGSAETPTEHKIAQMLERLRPRTPLRTDSYSAQVASFWSESMKVRGVSLPDVPDSKHLMLPSGCFVKQVVIQQTPDFSNPSRYTIDMDIYDRLDSDSQAALILHEVIYREAISVGHLDSIAVRYFNSYLFSGKVERLSQDEYQAFMIRVGLHPLKPNVLPSTSGNASLTKSLILGEDGTDAYSCLKPGVQKSRSGSYDYFWAVTQDPEFVPQLGEPNSTLQEMVERVISRL